LIECGGIWIGIEPDGYAHTVLGLFLPAIMSPPRL
jgi:hypothetical protein